MSKPNVFISYSNKDAEIAESFYEGLKAANCQPFLSRKDIKIGDEWVTKIEDAITSFNYFIVLLSENSVKSDMVKEEIRRAKKRYDSQKKDQKLGIIPVRLNIPQNVSLDYDIDGYLNIFQQGFWANKEATNSLLAEIIELIHAQKDNSINEDEDEKAELNSQDENTPTTGSAPVEPIRLPGGPLEPNSKLYIQNWIDKSKKISVILEDNALLRIKAPQQYGKSSLLFQIINFAEINKHTVITINFNSLDQETVDNLNTLLKFICRKMCRSLGLLKNEENELFSSIWTDQQGPKENCDEFIEALLRRANCKIVLALDAVDRIFDKDSITEGFFSLIRAWSEKKSDKNFKNFKIAMSYSTDATNVIKNAKQSPFNVGSEFKLSLFSFDNLKYLQKCHGLNLNKENADYLYSLLGGHPYLIMQSLYYLSNPENNINYMKDNAVNQNSPFEEHLNSIYWKIKSDQNIYEAVKIILHNKNTHIAVDIWGLLSQIGLVKGSYQEMKITSSIYEQFLADRIN